MTKHSNTNQVQLYQAALLKHHQAPVGFNLDISQTSQANGSNMACGDEITIKIQIEQQIVSAITFSGESCAICRASASMMCQFIQGQKLSDIHENIVLTIELIKGQKDEGSTVSEKLPQYFSALNVVHKFPVRKQCALLPWQTLSNAL